MAPPAMALSRIFLSAALAFSISPHCARGMAQLLTYEYIGGFSLTSCAPAKVARNGAAASEQTTTTLPNCLFMIFPFFEVARILVAPILRAGSVHECIWHKSVMRLTAAEL